MKDVIMDLFCGGGGTTEGVLMALAALNVPDTDLEVIAINHWQVAIDTHTANHPSVKHRCASLGEIADPAKLVSRSDHRVKLMCASPECTHHSRARGGKPANDQSRASANLVLDFLDKLYVENLIVENVREFVEWSVLGVNGRPLKSKRGELFQAWLQALSARGYRYEWRILNCADFGTPSTRQRFFLIARRGNRRITWPEPTHLPTAALAQPRLFSESRKPWVTAREIIDWTNLGKDIFTERKKPLADKTMFRIRSGAKRFWGIDLDVAGIVHGKFVPFLVDLHGTGTARSIHDPVQAVTAGGNHIGLVQPLILPHRTFDNMVVDSPDRPLRTVTGTSSDFAIAQAFITPNFSEREGQASRVHSIDDPLPAATGRGCGNLAQPILVQIDQAGAKAAMARGVDSPSPTMVTKQNQALATPMLVTVNHGGRDTRVASVNSPLATVTGNIGDALCSSILVEYYGSQNMIGVDEPTPTVTTRDRFALVTARLGENVDLSSFPPGAKAFRLAIYFRMLTQQECARAQGFRPDYKWTGTKKEQQIQIGNAVPPPVAKALAMEVWA